MRAFPIFLCLCDIEINQMMLAISEAGFQRRRMAFATHLLTAIVA
jgi:hypothetical protein